MGNKPSATIEKDFSSSTNTFQLVSVDDSTPFSVVAETYTLLIEYAASGRGLSPSEHANAVKLIKFLTPTSPQPQPIKLLLYDLCPSSTHDSTNLFKSFELLLSLKITPLSEAILALIRAVCHFGTERHRVLFLESDCLSALPSSLSASSRTLDDIQFHSNLLDIIFYEIQLALIRTLPQTRSFNTTKQDWLQDRVYRGLLVPARPYIKFIAHNYKRINRQETKPKFHSILWSLFELSGYDPFVQSYFASLHLGLPLSASFDDLETEDTLRVGFVDLCTPLINWARYVNVPPARKRHTFSTLFDTGLMEWLEQHRMSAVHGRNGEAAREMCTFVLKEFSWNSNQKVIIRL
ncbi:hypothetical protein BLNAU_16611 [Blattamonas nauphoetae]|uniref:Uncharacterized protein n=1 Tax=Blattamonas nauphoetae TaxID=2049346 RepID=A0ABQ9XDR4_9EUKA|nr:hypothetical protein BLNAU_16611 [Blattamonas nauphoetae]